MYIKILKIKGKKWTYLDFEVKVVVAATTLEQSKE